MLEKMKTCPNCKTELTRDDWEHFGRESGGLFVTYEEWSCRCPHCKKMIWLEMPYRLNEDEIQIDITG